MTLYNKNNIILLNVWPVNMGDSLFKLQPWIMHHRVLLAKAAKSMIFLQP